MAVISKQFFYDRIDDTVKCSVLHYWEKNCWKTLISPNLVVDLIIGCAKFFLPIYLLKLLLNYRKMFDKGFIKSLVMSEVRAIEYGLVMGMTFVGSICFFRFIFGRFHYYTLVLVPGFISGLSLLVESQENHILDSLIFFNSFVESILKSVRFFNVFRLTKEIEIFMFMAVSASLMYLLEKRSDKVNFTYFWFYMPFRKLQDGADTRPSICYHTRSCIEYFYKGFTKFFALGYMANIIREFLSKSKILTKKPLVIFRILFNKANIKLGLFIGGYVGLYRIITCYLTRTKKLKKQFQGLIAGFFSGLMYAISPNIQVIVIGITTLCQLLYEHISKKLNIVNHYWPRQLLYMTCHAILMHYKFLYPDICPSYYSKMIDSCTNNRAADMHERLISKYFL